MTNLWVDANVLLRLITNDPLDMAERASRLAERAEQGEITLRVSPMIVAEIVWVLNSFYCECGFYRRLLGGSRSSRRGSSCFLRS